MKYTLNNTSSSPSLPREGAWGVSCSIPYRRRGRGGEFMRSDGFMPILQVVIRRAAAVGLSMVPGARVGCVSKVVDSPRRSDALASAVESHCALRNQLSFETPPCSQHAMMNDLAVAAASYDILDVPSLLVRYGTNHPSRRRQMTLNAITNDHTVAALRMTSLKTRVRTHLSSTKWTGARRWWAHSGRRLAAVR